MLSKVAATPGRWWLLVNEPLVLHTNAARPDVSGRRGCPCDTAAGSEAWRARSTKRDGEWGPGVKKTGPPFLNGTSWD